jgi:hypothetical protein
MDSKFFRQMQVPGLDDFNYPLKMSIACALAENPPPMA